MRKLNAVIYELKTLKDINERRERNIVSTAKNKQEILEEMGDNEKYYYYSFIKDNNFEYKNILLPFMKEEINDSKIDLTKSKACLEYRTKKIVDENGDFLPKNDRLNIIYIDVYFLKLRNKYYAIVQTGNKINRARIEKLIGEDNIIKENKEFKIDSEIFHWLMYVYEEKDKELNDKLTIENISGFEGIITDDTNTIIGDSKQTTDLIATKAFISNGGDLKKIHISVKDDQQIEVVFLIDSSSSISIDCKETIEHTILNPYFEKFGKEIYAMLYIYCFLIHKLKKIYKEDSNQFLTSNKQKFSRRIGLEVIKSIMEYNNLKIEDLKM